MTFHTIREASIRRGSAIYRESFLNKLTGLFFAFALFAVPAFIGVQMVRSPGPTRNTFPLLVLGIALLFLLILILFFLKSLRAVLGDQNWLIRSDSGGMLIKFRSYLNDHFPDGPVVLELFPQEIVSIGRTQEKRISRRANKSVFESITYLDIETAQDLDALSERLKQERSFSVKSKFHHYPVQALEGGVIRVLWRSGKSWVSPSAAKAVDELSRMLRVKTREDFKFKNDFTVPPTDQVALDERIRVLLVGGDHLQAVDQAIKFLKIDRAAAKQYVAEVENSSEGVGGEAR